MLLKITTVGKLCDKLMKLCPTKNTTSSVIIKFPAGLQIRGHFKEIAEKENLFIFLLPGQILRTLFQQTIPSAYHRVNHDPHY